MKGRAAFSFWAYSSSGIQIAQGRGSRNRGQSRPFSRQPGAQAKCKTKAIACIRSYPRVSRVRLVCVNASPVHCRVEARQGKLSEPWAVSFCRPHLILEGSRAVLEFHWIHGSSDLLLGAGRGTPSKFRGVSSGFSRLAI